jgi:AcrR family transcriptional regulator
VPRAAKPKPARSARAGRKEAILAAAADLFSNQGYAGTGIDEIGEAAGITGPGVYRHFDGKSAVLNEVITRLITDLLAGVGDVVATADDPEATLGGLVDNLVRSVLADRQAWGVFTREQRHLEPSSRSKVNRAHRLHVEEWVHALVQLRPELDEAEARTVVHGAFGIVASIIHRHRPGVSDAALAAALHDGAMTVLLRTPAPR